MQDKAKFRALLQVRSVSLEHTEINIQGGQQSYDLFSTELDHKRYTQIKEEELRVFLHKAQAGCTKSRDKVFEVNTKFIYQCARRFSARKGHVLEFLDFVSIGYEAIVDAIDGWEPRPTRFLSYAV